MAGTRFLLVLAYLVQISIVVLISISSSLQTKGKSTWYNYRNHQSLLPVRRGTLVFEDFQTTISELKSLIISTTFKLRVELCFSAGSFSEDDQISTLSVLKAAFSDFSSTTTSLDFILRSSISENTETNQKGVNPSNIYQLHFSLDAMISEIQYRAKLYVNDEGQMFFRVKPGLHRDDYHNLIRNDLASYLKYMLLTNDAVGIPATEITVRLVDSDPLSNMASNEHNQNVISHQTMLSNTFMHEMNETLSEMVHSRLNLYRHFSLKAQTYNLFGFDLTTNTQEIIDADGKRQHVLHTDNATSLMERDLSKLMYRSTIPFHEHVGSPSSINCILFIPKASCTPLFFINANQQSQAISLERKRTIISIANIYQTLEEINDVESYKLGIHQSLSLIGGFIRHEIGLRRIRSEHTIGELQIQYENGHGGIRLWEIENLIRGSFHNDAIKVVESLERVFELIFVRNGISVSIESSQRIVSCADILHRALHSIASKSDDLTLPNQLINDAIILSSQILSDDELFELPHIPRDQMFAVFGSLLLPLFLPLLKNLAVEAKRYKSFKTKSIL